jgi:uncharacterized protein YggE
MHTQRFWQSIALLGLVVVLVAGAALTFSAARPATAQTAQPGTIVVSGYGDATGAPDIAIVTLGLDMTNEDLSAAVSEADSGMAAIVDAITALGVAAEDIQTVNYSVWSQDGGVDGMQPDAARIYHLSNIISIKVRDMTQVQAVLSAALRAGANAIQGVAFSIEDASSLERDARLAAIEDARERAAQIAEAIGASLGEIVAVNEGGTSSAPLYDRAMGGGGGIQQGQLSVSIGLEVTFAITR